MKFIKVLLIIIFFSISTMADSFAQNIPIAVNGVTDSKAAGISLVILKKGRELNNDTKKSSIIYINQYDIEDDGRFTVELPFFSSENYNFYSNLGKSESNENNIEKNTLYLSNYGNDKNDGYSEEKPLKTFEEAYCLLDYTNEIVLLDNYDYQEPPQHNGDLTILGHSSDICLALPSEISLKGNLKIDNVKLCGESTIYANGYDFEIGNGVASDSRLTVYGGRNGQSLDGDTNIRLFGGQYYDIFGGGNGGEVTGSTYVTVGGNTNLYDGIDDTNQNTLSPCFIRGGGNNAPVGGKTNVTLQDNAVARYIVGAGLGEKGTVNDTNININGGKVVNVYAGSQNTVLPAGTVTHLTITGGVAEFLCGGCESVAMTGHTYVNLLGGEITRRVYTGCYNGTSLDGSILPQIVWSGDNYVTGTTTLTFSKPVKVNTKNGLNGDENNVNVGVFSGSRTKTQHDKEVNTVIFLDDCYSEYKNSMQDSGYWYFQSDFKSFHDYVIKSGVGGTVYGTGTAGEVYIKPELGNYGTIENQNYVNENAVLTASETNVIFKKNFEIQSVNAYKTENGINAGVNVLAENVTKKYEPYMIVNIYDDTGKFISCDIQEIHQTDYSRPFSVNCILETGKAYTIKAVLWDISQEPLTMAYTLTVQ